MADVVHATEATVGQDDAESSAALAVAWNNRRILYVLERLAARFHQAGVPLMALKGAALQLTLYRQPWQRTMGDLDVLVSPDRIEQAMELIRAEGGQISQTLMRPDFFPRYYYEAQITFPGIVPVVMDLHIRPFRPLRYARHVPDDGLWDRALPVDLGGHPVMIPSPDDMLLHLAVHLAIHGGAGQRWRRDIVQWIARYGDVLDWDRLLRTAWHWHLSLPLREGLRNAQECCDEQLLPRRVKMALLREPAGWRDRLALWQAPRDNDHPLWHVAVSALTTPGLCFVAGYLWAALVPQPAHMRESYPYDHWGWLPAAHALRFTRPLWGWLRPLLARWRGVEVVCDDHGRRVLATSRVLEANSVVLRREQGGLVRYMATGLHPNVRRVGGRILAIRRLRRGEHLVLPSDPTSDNRETEPIHPTPDQPDHQEKAA
ncbi:MAG: nucleotidyltransferase family protein [Phycisphaeraceae bacterium]|nr:nucleotidyltransferase family protein [Phycisphaeraceae bacterium]